MPKLSHFWHLFGTELAKGRGRGMRSWREEDPKLLCQVQQGRVSKNGGASGPGGGGNGHGREQQRPAADNGRSTLEWESGESEAVKRGRQQACPWAWSLTRSPARPSEVPTTATQSTPSLGSRGYRTVPYLVRHTIRYEEVNKQPARRANGQMMETPTVGV